MWELEHQKLFQATRINYKTKTFESWNLEAGKLSGARELEFPLVIRSCWTG